MNIYSVKKWGNQYGSGVNESGCLAYIGTPMALLIAVGVTTIGNEALNLFAAIVIIVALIFGIFLLSKLLNSGASTFLTILLIILLIPFVIGAYNIIVTPAVFISNSARTPKLAVEQLQSDFVNNVSRNNITVQVDGRIITLTRDNISDISIIGYRDLTTRGKIGASGQIDDRIHNISFNLVSLDNENNIITYNVNAEATYTFNRIMFSSYGGWRTWVLRSVDNYIVDGENVADTGSMQNPVEKPETGASQGIQEALDMPEVIAPFILEGTTWEGSYASLASLSVSAFNRYVTQDRLVVKITEVTSDGMVKATITASSPDISQTARGTFNFDTFYIELLFDNWIVKPAQPEGLNRYEAYLSAMEINLMGTIDIINSTMESRQILEGFVEFKLTLKD